MSIINCSDYGKEVSDGAPASPGCGKPIANAGDIQATGVALVTIQEASKRF